MAIRSKSEKTFDRSTPVARYWLTQCEGFRVQGSVKGTVEEILGSVDTQRAQVLVVRRAWRRHSVPVTSVDAVVPAARLIVLTGPENADASQHRQARAAMAMLAANGAPVGRFVVDSARALVLVVAAALVRLARTLHTGARALAATAARLLADARAQRWAAADERRRRTRASSREDRKLTRAAVLGVERRGGHKP